MYHAYYESDKRDRREILYMLEAYSKLAKIADFPEIIDDEHDIISKIAGFAVKAILQIGHFEDKYPDIKWATTMCDVAYCGVFVGYDFEKDTPQDVWDRFFNALSD